MMIVVYPVMLLDAIHAYLFQHSPEEARYLWTAMATNNTGGPDDPRYHMFSLAQNTEASTGPSFGIRRASVTIQAFIRGWNLMVERKSLSTKLSIAPLPADTVHIEGISNAGSEAEIAHATERTQEEIISTLMTQLSIALPKQNRKERGKGALK